MVVGLSAIRYSTSCCTLSLNCVGRREVTTLWSAGLLKARHARQVLTVPGIIFRTSSLTPAARSMLVILVMPAWYHLMCRRRNCLLMAPGRCDRRICSASSTLYRDQSKLPPAWVSASACSCRFLIRFLCSFSALDKEIMSSSSAVCAGSIRWDWVVSLVGRLAGSRGWCPTRGAPCRLVSLMWNRQPPGSSFSSR